MSVLAKDPMDGLIKLYVKGADTTIEERLDPDSKDNLTIESVRDFTQKASVMGLRTLYVAMKIVDE